MPRNELVLTPMDLRLLARLVHTPHLAQACRELRVTRDQANYRLRRLGQYLGRPVVTARKGPPGSSWTRLTRAGRGLLSQRPGTPLRALRTHPGAGTLLFGRYSRGPPPSLTTGNGLVLSVGFPGREGELRGVAVDPEAVLVARRRFLASARNILPARILSLKPRGPVQVIAVVESRGERLPVALTEAAVRALHLRRGSRVFLYLKATALRPLPP